MQTIRGNRHSNNSGIRQDQFYQVHHVSIRTRLIQVIGAYIVNACERIHDREEHHRANLEAGAEDTDKSSTHVKWSYLGHVLGAAHQR